ARSDTQTLWAPTRPLVISRRETRLTVRLIPDSPDDLLVLEEERTTPDYAALQRLGLTPREAEGLHGGMDGETNRRIGARLHTSPRTIDKHLERIFAKLNVTTRMAAANQARGLI